MHLALEHLDVLGGRVLERLLPSHRPDRDATARPRLRRPRHEGGRAPAAHRGAQEAADAAGVHRVLRRPVRPAFRRRERAAEPGALGGPRRARVPPLRRRPHAEPLGRATRRRGSRSRSHISRPRASQYVYDPGVASTAKPATLDPLDFLAIDALLDEEERAIRDTVRQFVRERIVPEVGEWFEQGILPREIVQEIAPARPLRHAPRRLRPPRRERGRVRADVPGARGGRLRHPQPRLGAGLARDVRDLEVGLRGAEAALAARDAHAARRSAASA